MNTSKRIKTPSIEASAEPSNTIGIQIGIEAKHLTRSSFTNFMKRGSSNKALPPYNGPGKVGKFEASG